MNKNVTMVLLTSAVLLLIGTGMASAYPSSPEQLTGQPSTLTVYFGAPEMLAPQIQPPSNTPTPGPGSGVIPSGIDPTNGGAIPEPGTFVLLGLGISGLLWLRYKKQ